MIAPLAGSAYRQAANFAGVPWDMVVVDEAHHLLASPVLYDFVQGLSPAQLQRLRPEQATTVTSHRFNICSSCVSFGCPLASAFW